MSHDTISEIALAWHRAGKGAVIATVTQTWGSAPRRAGAQLVVSASGDIEGSVSGGCVEGAVVLEAQDALAKGEMRNLEFGVADEDAFAVGLACGGTIKVVLEPVGSVLPEELLSGLVTACKAAKPVAYVLNPETQSRELVYDGFEDRFRLDRSGFEEDGRFVAIHNPPLRLIIVGAVHIAQALVSMAKTCGFAPVLIDPRDSFGSKARFPGMPLLNHWPDEAMTALKPDARTAVVLLSHDPKLDDPALHVALGSDVFYIGALGSSKTQAKRRARLGEAGFTEDQIGRIHGPVGLDIGAANPSEIAVSILAEILRVLRKGGA